MKQKIFIILGNQLFNPSFFLKFKKNFKSSYLKDYKFYTLPDKKYRYARDIILEKKE